MPTPRTQFQKEAIASHRAGMKNIETHEPAQPIDWPNGHVSVASDLGDGAAQDRLRLADVDVTITDMDASECILVSLGDHDHYLHSTTARELGNMLFEFGERAGGITIHGVTHAANRAAVRSLSQLLERRLTEWNHYARSAGALGV